MPKALVTNRIYLDKPDALQLAKITKALTYKLPKKFIPNAKMGAIETITAYKLLPNGILSIPKMRLDLIPENYEIVDKRTLCPVGFPAPLHNLYPEQEVVYNQVEDSCLVNALVGWGKSFTALFLARKLGQKTLIVVHTLYLLEQWRDNVRVLFGIEPGVITAGILDYKDSPIVISNTQSLAKQVPKLVSEFGTVVIDECHRTPSTTFTNIVDSLKARYVIGLSGTLIRKDGKHVLFRNYFGSTVFTPPKSNTLTPEVKIVKTGISLNANLPWASRITELVQNQQYQAFIATLALGYMDKGHKVLVLADRVEFLEILGELIGDKCAVVTGTTGDRELVKKQVMSGEKSCIAGSRQIFSEGVSINALSCVILCVPMNNDSLLEQIIGRIQRLHPNKLTPLVLDMNFSGPTDRAQNESRFKFYLSKGWAIQS